MAGREVPEDFAAFVRTYGRRLVTACQEIAGNDRVADAMQVDLLAAVAVSWNLRPARWRFRHALTRLDRLLRREVRSYRLLPTLAARQIRMAQADDQLLEPPDGDDADAARVAAAAWRRATVLRRQGRLGLAAAVLVLMGFALVAPNAGPLPAPPSPEPTSTPDGVTVLPAFHDLSAQLRPGSSPLPAQLALDPAAVAGFPPLATSPLPQAVAVAEPSRGLLIVIGPNGTTRQIDDPVLVNARLVTTSLSPTGDLVVLPRGNDLLAIDIGTGAIRPIPAGARQPDPPVVVWHSRQTVLVPGPTGALEVDVVTGRISTLGGVTGTDVVTVEGNPAAPFAEMVAASAAGGQRSQIRLWRTAPAALPATATATPPPTSPSVAPSQSAASPARGDYDERPVSGPTWISAWLGPAWSSALLYARACSPITLRLPPDVGVALAAIGALQPNGRYAGTLVAVDSTQLEILGFVRADQLLVAARFNGATTLLGWTPIGGAVTLVAQFTAEVRLSVADLLLPS